VVVLVQVRKENVRLFYYERVFKKKKRKQIIMSKLAQQRHAQFLRENPRSVPNNLFMSHQGLKHAQEHLVSSRCVRYSILATLICIPIVLFALFHHVYHSLFATGYYQQ